MRGNKIRSDKQTYIQKTTYNNSNKIKLKKVTE